MDVERFKRFLNYPNKTHRIIRLIFDVLCRPQGKRILARVKNYKLTDQNILLSHEKTEIVISLTTYPARFKTIGLTLKSLLMQDFPVDKIVVWLGNDASEEDLNDEMLQYAHYGVEYRFVDDNIKPHKKYYYAMEEYADSVIITVDDDIIYPRNMVSRLMKAHKKFPQCVCANRVHRIEFCGGGKTI